MYLGSNQRSVTEFVERVARCLLPEDFSARESQQEAELRTEQAERNARVPVFVCTTAFPTVPCPLFVFEPRYRLMVRRAVESGQRQFGIATCVDQNATGQRRYSEFGTILEIRDQVCLSSGCSILTTVGCSRFRVLEGGEADGYDLAKVEFLQDEPVTHEALPGLLKLHEDTKKKANLWVSTLSDTTKAEVSRSLGEMPQVEDNWTSLPDGPSWTWWLLALLPLGPKLKVGILGTTSLEKRLRAIDKTLDHIAMQRFAARTTVSQPDEDSCQTRL
ncbi:hypothetical protein B566_EDAN016058 [Ephemera danica]|nr:hypothetical protein B566_EDAN016058 [Ephemera danica]